MSRTSRSHPRSRGKPEVTARAPMRTDLHQAVLGRIVRGELAPGARIKESHLSKELGASRTPMREALLYLEREGFVRSELARGFSVEPLSGREVRESYPILWTLEELALRASGPILGSLVEQLSKLNSDFVANTEPEHAIECDSRWHETLLASCPNQRLNQMLARLRATLRRYEHIYMRDSMLIAESASQHARVIEAISAKDTEAAVAALVGNWRFGMETLLLRLGEP
jgi:DNA-binding GntR family transcriptional regulator